MAHELTRTDGLVLTGERAWHGLGTIVENAPNALEALKLARLDWQIEQWPLSATNGESKIALGKYRANIRVDTKAVLGVVGDGWTPFQNKDMAEFCEALAEQNDQVKIETAGSIRGGKKVWFLIRGESFSVHGVDEVKPYILVSNGHDGFTGFRCTPTTVRVVCSNTLHMVIPSYAQDEQTIKKLTPNSYVCRHTGGLMAKVEEAKQALALYTDAVSTQRELIDEIAARDVGREDVQRFFLEAYARTFGGIADVPTTDKERKAREKALEAAGVYTKRFEKEEGFSGPNRWTMMNAFTGWLQHDRPTRGKDPAKVAEAKINSNLFGTNSEASILAFQLALAT